MLHYFGLQHRIANDSTAVQQTPRVVAAATNLVGEGDRRAPMNNKGRRDGNVLAYNTYSGMVVVGGVPRYYFYVDRGI